MEKHNDINKLLVQIGDQFPAMDKAIYQQLIRYLNDLLNDDLNGLIQVLYRIDIDEQKLKLILSGNPATDAAVLIADLLIKRQLEKIAVRKQFQGKKDVSGDEEW